MDKCVVVRMVQWTALACTLAMASAACGGKDGASTTQPAGISGVAGGTSIEGAITCGGTLCAPFNGPGLNFPLQPCCADQFSRTCGIRSGSACLKAPARHPTCSSLDLTDFSPGLVLFGCCTNNKCGLLDPFEGTGTCRDIETIQAEAAAAGDDSSGLPQPMACD